jgi:hypothetical protein
MNLIAFCSNVERPVISIFLFIDNISTISTLCFVGIISLKMQFLLHSVNGENVQNHLKVLMDNNLRSLWCISSLFMSFSRHSVSLLPSINDQQQTFSTFNEKNKMFLNCMMMLMMMRERNVDADRSQAT